MLLHGKITDAILAGVVEVHKLLGPGLLESVYEECLCHELSLRGLAYRRQVDLPITYKGATLASGYRVDILVEDVIIVELKSIEALLPIHEAQLLTYLRLSGIRVGLLINFNVTAVKEGIMRRVL
jgi:GxxExxY protein